MSQGKVYVRNGRVIASMGDGRYVSVGYTANFEWGGELSISYVNSSEVHRAKRRWWNSEPKPSTIYTGNLRSVLNQVKKGERKFLDADMVTAFSKAVNVAPLHLK